MLTNLISDGFAGFKRLVVVDGLEAKMKNWGVTKTRTLT